MSQIGAIPFVQYDQQRSAFYIHDDAIRTLSAIKTKLSVVVVAGPYRSGKSTLLNMLVSRPNKSSTGGFAVGGTTTAVTKGIWLWSQPTVHTDSNTGETITTIFLDSEGLGSTDTTTTFDVQIFSMSILLCSLFVLNTTGAINEQSLDQLDLVVHMTQKIRATDSKSDDSLNDLSTHMPAFIWVLRDFVLQLISRHDSTRAITSTQYLEECLEPVQSKKQSTDDKNRIRTVLKTVFAHRDCMTFVRPVTDEAQLQRLDQVDQSQYRNEFKQQVAVLKQRIHQMATPKQVNQQYVNGAMLCQLAQQYCNSINQGSVVSINSAWSNVLQIQGRDALTQAQRYVQEQFAHLTQGSDIVSDEVLQRSIDNISQHASTVVREATMHNATIETALLAQLKQFVDSAAASLRHTYTLRSNEFNRQLITGLVKQSQLEQMVSQRKYDTLSNVLNKVREQYTAQAKGSTADAVYVEYTHHMYQSITAALMTHITEVTQQLSTLKTQYDNDAKQYKSMEAEHNKQVRQHELNVQKLQLMHDNTAGEAKRLNDEKQQMSTQLQQAQMAVNQATSERSERARHVDQLQTQLNNLNAQLTSMQQQHTNNERKISQLQQQLSETGSSATQQVKTLQQQLSETQAQLNNQSNQHTKQMNNAQKQLNDAQNDTASLNSEIEQLRAQARQATSSAASNKQYEQQMKQLNDQLAQSQQVAKSLQSDKQSLEREIADYEAEQSKLLAQIKTLKQQQTDSRLSNGSHNNDAALDESMSEADVASVQSSQPARAAASLGGSRFTAEQLADAKRRSTGRFGEIEDPNTLTIPKLKSWLTDANVEFPVKSHPKQFYVELMYQTFPMLDQMYPRAEKKGKK